MEQKAVIEFNFKLDKTITEMYKSIAYGSGCLLRSKIFKWYKRFKEGRELKIKIMFITFF